MKIEIYLAGLIDNGLNGIVGGIGESDCSLRCGSIDRRGRLLIGSDLGWDVTIRCCKRDFRGCFMVVRRSANWSCVGLDSVVDDIVGKGSWVRTSDMDLSASTTSSRPFIDNLTSAIFDSIIVVEFWLISLLTDEGVWTSFSKGDDWFLGDIDGILKENIF